MPGYITLLLSGRVDMGHDQADCEMNNEKPSQEHEILLALGALRILLRVYRIYYILPTF